jgi:hypothetical protein
VIIELINDMDSLYVPEDWKHDFRDIDESIPNFRDILVRRKHIMECSVYRCA